MTKVRTRIRIAADGTISGHAQGLPAGDHDAEISLVEPARLPAEHDFDDLLRRVRAIQAEIARLPVLDARDADEIIGYNDEGHVD